MTVICRAYEFADISVLPTRAGVERQITSKAAVGFPQLRQPAPFIPRPLVRGCRSHTLEKPMDSQDRQERPTQMQVPCCAVPDGCQQVKGKWVDHE